MSEPQTSASPVEPVTQTQAQSSKWPLWLVGVVALVALSILAWLAPAYKKEVSDNESKTKTIADLQTQLVEAKKTTVVRIPVLVGGKVAYRTTSVTTTDTRSITTSNTVSSTDTRSHKEVVTKRGLLTVMGYVDINKELGGSFSFNVLGPLDIGAFVNSRGVMVGTGLSF